MLSLPKPLQLTLSAACLTGIPAFASADQVCCTGTVACEVDCSEGIAHVQGLFERIVTPIAPDCGSAPGSLAKKRDDSVAPWEELTSILATRPETWSIIKPMILATFASKASEAIRNNVLSLLAQQYSERAVAIASELAESYPETDFTQDQVVAFAEAGSKRFWGIAVDLQQIERDPATHGADRDARRRCRLPIHTRCTTRVCHGSLSTRRPGGSSGRRIGAQGTRRTRAPRGDPGRPARLGARGSRSG